MANLLPDVSTLFVTVCKKAYKPLRAENDELLISNWGALRLALDALNKEDASDFTRADQLWAQAKKLLIAEEENEVGAGAQGPVPVEDSFAMECFPVGL